MPVFKGTAKASDPGSEACADPAAAGSLQPNPEDCHSFYACVDNGMGGNIPYLFNCPPTTAFDGENNV